MSFNGMRNWEERRNERKERSEARKETDFEGAFKQVISEKFKEVKV